ncbi:MAG: hypothetical protein JW999_02475 [Methanotrichaceae archaeon]|nr:hypothetical protein [Methanotrichaceae archaeon]
MIISGKAGKHDENFDSKASRSIVIAGKAIQGNGRLFKPLSRQAESLSACAGCMNLTDEILFALGLAILIFGAVFSMAFAAGMEAFL